MKEISELEAKICTLLEERIRFHLGDDNKEEIKELEKRLEDADFEVGSMKLEVEISQDILKKMKESQEIELK